MMNDLIYLDTETTGLDPEKHDVWEIAWAVNDVPVEERILVHSLKAAEYKALEMNGYFYRHAGALPRSDGPWVDLDVRKILEGNTLVCANPTFDRMFLRKRWGLEPYHYRSIDVESVALGVLQLDRPKGLKDIAEALRKLGYAISVPDHSAAKDVEVLRECFIALRGLQQDILLGRRS